MVITVDAALVALEMVIALVSSFSDDASSTRSCLKCILSLLLFLFSFLLKCLLTFGILSFSDGLTDVSCYIGYVCSTGEEYTLCT